MANQKNQCIHCSVESCQFHDQTNYCSLPDIKVEPRKGCCDGSKDESCCSSYKCRW